MPDHARDRGAVRLDLGAARSQAYQPDEVGGQKGSDLEQGMQIAEMCQNIRSHDSDRLSWPPDGTSLADISPGWDALGVAGIPEATGAGGLWSGCVGHDAVVAAAALALRALAP
jgi:hypothetical protein